MFALVHLLIVAPYLDAARRMEALQPAISANAKLLAELEPEMARLRDAEASAAKQIEALLQAATARLVEDFSALREAITRVTVGGEPALEMVAELAEPGPPPQMMAQMNLPAAVATPSVAEREANLRLASILEALAAGAPDARDRLKE